MKAESWKRLTQAQEYYEGQGFKYVELDWLISPELSALTKPAFARDFYIDDKVLVGSAEQAFLGIYDELDDGLYYSITPCFRDEKVDYWHQQGFMKLELFSKDIHQVGKLLADAVAFYRQFTKTDLEINEIGYDIISKGIELGSYGVRLTEDKQWTFGTGLAEPRLTKVLSYEM